MCVADNKDDEREILPYLGTKSKSEVAAPLTTQKLTLKLCQEPLQTLQANVTPIKPYRLYALSSLVRLRSLGKRYTPLPLKAVNPIQITARGRKRSDSVLLEKTLYQCLEILSKA